VVTGYYTILATNCDPTDEEVVKQKKRKEDRYWPYRYYSYRDQFNQYQAV
jgi:hypothetical protein